MLQLHAIDISEFNQMSKRTNIIVNQWVKELRLSGFVDTFVLMSIVLHLGQIHIYGIVELLTAPPSLTFEPCNAPLSQHCVIDEDGDKYL
jgi:hypothetical protein